MKFSLIKLLTIVLVTINLTTMCHAGEKSRLISNLESGKKQTLITYGTSLTSHGAWVPQLQQELNKRYPGKALVINSGKSGKASDWGLENLESRVIARRPDTVIIEFAMNDAFQPYKISVKKAQSNLENMINRILETNPDCEIILMVMNTTLGKAKKARPDLLKHNKMYRDVAQKRKFLLIDHYQNWKKILDDNPKLFDKYVPDGIHPKAEGCKAVITPQIIKSLGMGSK
jgi:lysophospholipase L1-like esterase